MILIDAVFINISGGKILLDYLIKSIEETNLEVFYLLDNRIRKNVSIANNENNVFFASGYLDRVKFYNSIRKDDFTFILCFGNIPPHRKMNSIVYTYLHQLLYLETKKVKFKDRVLLTLKKMVIMLTKRNTDKWMVQTPNIKVLLNKKFNIPGQNIVLMPFYVEINPEREMAIEREKYQYIYISNGYPHKNHLNLIEGFCDFYDLFNKGKLIVTISKDFPTLYSFIEERIKLGYPIINLEYIPHKKLKEIYLKSYYCVYPSFLESFGLGIIEAIDCGCKIIGADLKYMHDVCEPSILFDPTDKSSIKEAFIQSLEEKIPNSLKKIPNKMNKLIEMFTNI